MTNTSNRYMVKYWLLERSACEPSRDMTAEQAINAAYNHIGGNPMRFAHIYPEGSQSGIFIARDTDLDTFTREQLTDRLASWTWR